MMKDDTKVDETSRNDFTKEIWPSILLTIPRCLLQQATASGLLPGAQEDEDPLHDEPPARHASRMLQSE